LFKNKKFSKNKNDICINKKNKMKKIFLLLVLFQTFFLTAQSASFNASDASGIFYYNVKEVVNKSKIKKDNIKLITTNAIRKYNDKIKEISFLNSFKFKELETLINGISKDASTLSEDQRMNLRSKIEEIIVPIRDSVVKYEKTLNDKLEQSLSEKQNRKWLKYQKQQKRKLIPEDTRQRPNNQQMMNRRGQRNRRY